MKSEILQAFIVDKANNKIKIEREFAAPVEKVWAAWTQSELLDQWWAPYPWKAITKKMDFSVGGYWLYAMKGPDGTEHWSRADFRSITPLEQFTARDAFCDAEGTINKEMAGSSWKINFKDSSGSTIVSVVLTFESLSDLEQLVEMGFKEGFAAGLENLENLLGKL